MIIKNETTVTLKILGSELKPKESRKLPEMMFNTLNIVSKNGGCVITIKCGKLSFINYGKIIAKECNNKKIIISSID